MTHQWEMEGCPWAAAGRGGGRTAGGRSCSGGGIRAGGTQLTGRVSEITEGM